MRIKQITHRISAHRAMARQERALDKALSVAQTPSARAELLALRSH